MAEKFTRMTMHVYTYTYIYIFIYIFIYIYILREITASKTQIGGLGLQLRYKPLIKKKLRARRPSSA